MKHNDPYQQLANNCASADGGTAVLPKKVKKKLKLGRFTTEPDGHKEPNIQDLPDSFGEQMVVFVHY